MIATSTEDLIEQVVEIYVHGDITFEVFEDAIGFLFRCKSDEPYPWADRT